jgi:enolase-phosphatase E1
VLVRLHDSAQIRAILLDIEGTTTPIGFVYDVLFPYAARNLDRYFRQHFHDLETAPYFAQLKEQRMRSADSYTNVPDWHNDSVDAEIGSLVSYAQWLMQRDSKLTALKVLQGNIWQEGYAHGELCGQVYPDVPSALRRWREHNKSVYIYSSGSELAQKLLFQTTEYGDLTRLLRGFLRYTCWPKGRCPQLSGDCLADLLRPTARALYLRFRE